MISQIKPLKIKSFLPFNFAITKICVAIHLAEDGTRMGGIYFRLFLSKFCSDQSQLKDTPEMKLNEIYSF